MSVADAIAAVREWPALQPLLVEVSPRPLPIDMFAPWVREMIEAVAEATKFDRDMATAYALGALSTCAQGRLAVQAFPDWTEQVCLYLAVVAEASEGKSPVYKPMTAPLHELNAELGEQTAGDVAIARAKVAAAEAKQKKATQDLANAREHDRILLEDTIRECAAELAKPPPAAPVLVVDDITPETLGMMMGSQGERVSILTSEDHLFAHLSGRYSAKAPPIEIFLKAYTGEPMRVDRRDRVVSLRKPCLTICAAMQPSVLSGKGAELADDRGLLARFLFVRPPRKTGYRDLSIDPGRISSDIADAYRVNIRRRIQQFRPQNDVMVVGLSDAAMATWKAWRVALEDRRKLDGQLASILTWAGKADGAALRLAGLLWLTAPTPDQRVSAAQMEGATRLLDAFADHAMATLGLSCATLEVRSAHAVLTWLDRRGESTFTERDASRAGLAKGLDLRRGVNELVRRGYLRLMPTARSGRPTLRWEVRGGVLSGSGSAPALAEA